METRLFNVLDVARRARNEAGGRYANMRTRSSGGQSNKVVMVASGERMAPNDFDLKFNTSGCNTQIK